MSRIGAEMNYRLISGVVLTATLIWSTGCASKIERKFIDPMEEAHGEDAWERTEALRADIRVVFGDTELVSGTMTFETNGPRARLDVDDGTTVVYDGQTAWVTPPDSDFNRPRFHVLTWPWFVVTPFKLEGEGVNLALHRPLMLHGREHLTAKMTFEPGEGDTPEDWYILYKEPVTDRLAAQAYIVTYGKSEDPDELMPHSIVYDGYMEIDNTGVILSTDWEFFHWSEEQGPHGEPLGHAWLTDIHFVRPENRAFRRPEDSREAKLPESQ